MTKNSLNFPVEICILIKHLRLVITIGTYLNGMCID